MSDTGVPANAGTAAVQGKVEDLARRASLRDEAAWAEIFELHYRNVFAFLRSRVPTVAEAEDLASQVFEVGFSKAKSFDYRGLPIEAWLIGIARNLCRDYLKKMGRRGPSLELDETMSADDPDLAGDFARRTEITKAMQTLTEDQQTVLSLRFVLDRPVNETAAAMQRSEDAVKNLQRRALASLRRALEREGWTS